MFGYFSYPCYLLLIVSSILNVPGESTLRRDFQRLQQENKERSEAHKRQQAQLAAQRRDPEEHKRQLLHDRQKRIEEQKEQRRRLEEVLVSRYCNITAYILCVCSSGCVIRQSQELFQAYANQNDVSDLQSQDTAAHNIMIHLNMSDGDLM